MSDHISAPASGALTVNVALTVPRTEAEGPGLRYALWVQGCPMRCPGCCNPEMLEFRRRDQRPVAALVEEICGAGVEGVSLLGGEPFAQAGALAALAAAVKARGLTVMIYSGFTLGELRDQAKADPDVADLLAATDLLVDGRYVAKEASLDRRWIGSDNQQLHHLTDAYRGSPRLQGGNTVEIRLRGGEILLNGWPTMGARTAVARARSQGERQQPTHRLDEAEGYALDFAEGLISGRWRLPPAPISLKTPRVALAAAASERIGKGALRRLTDEGGHRERAALRQGRRIRGRIWDEALNEGFRLRYTSATTDLWRMGIRVVPMMLSEEGMRPSQMRSTVRKWIKGQGTDVGDWLVYYLLGASARRLPASALWLDEIQRRLVVGSPLCALAALQCDDDQSPHHSLAALVSLPGARLVECLEGSLIERWLMALGTAPANAPQWRGRAEALNRWLTALDEGRRLDLASGVMRLLPRWLEAVLARAPHLEGPQAVAAALRPPTASARERQLEMAAVASIFEVGDRLLALRREMASARYGDERYEEAQLYLAGYERWLAPAQGRINATARHLRGVI